MNVMQLNKLEWCYSVNFGLCLDELIENLELSLKKKVKSRKLQH